MLGNVSLPPQHPIIRMCLVNWNDHVEHGKQNALGWHRYWKQNGCPHHGHISEMRRITRARYHRVIRHVEKNANVMKMQKMTESRSLLDKRSRDMWAEFRKLKC